MLHIPSQSTAHCWHGTAKNRVHSRAWYWQQQYWFSGGTNNHNTNRIWRSRIINDKQKPKIIIFSCRKSRYDRPRRQFTVTTLRHVFERGRWLAERCDHSIQRKRGNPNSRKFPAENGWAFACILRLSVVRLVVTNFISTVNFRCTSCRRSDDDGILESWSVGIRIHIISKFQVIPLDMRLERWHDYRSSE